MYSQKTFNITIIQSVNHVILMDFYASRVELAMCGSYETFDGFVHR